MIVFSLNEREAKFMIANNFFCGVDIFPAQ